MGDPMAMSMALDGRALCQAVCRLSLPTTAMKGGDCDPTDVLYPRAANIGRRPGGQGTYT